MLEDGLDLWKSLLRYAPVPTEPLMKLAPLAVQLVTDDSDILPKVLRIIESYILLNPETFLKVSLHSDVCRKSSHWVALTSMPCLLGLLQAHAGNIMREIAALLIRLDDKACKPLLYTTDLLLQSCPPAMWAPAFHQSGFIAAMLRITLSSVRMVLASHIWIRLAGKEEAC